jgi:hypothetical protein
VLRTGPLSAYSLNLLISARELVPLVMATASSLKVFRMAGYRVCGPLVNWNALMNNKVCLEISRSVGMSGSSFEELNWL